MSKDKLKSNSFMAFKLRDPKLTRKDNKRQFSLIAFATTYCLIHMCVCTKFYIPVSLYIQTTTTINASQKHSLRTGQSRIGLH